MGKGKIKSGDTVVLAAFGSGFTWEASLSNETHYL
jgi:3-oxoacyl-[acyl-carrier-protein] synthase III